MMKPKHKEGSSFMKNRQFLNLNWKFKDNFNPEYITRKSYDDFQTIHIPHTVKEVPYDCFDEFMFCFLSTYVRFFELPELGERQVVVEFEGVSAYYELYVNERRVADHKGAYSTAVYDITEYVHAGENKLLLMVDSHERGDIPPTGSTVDFLLYGGIYRDVSLYLLDSAFISNALICYELNGSATTVAPEVILSNAGTSFIAEVRVEISREGKVFHRFERKVEVVTGESNVKLDPENLPGIERWDLDTPVLYDIKTTLLREGKEADTHTTRVGFRTVRAEVGGFYLNERKVKIIGMNRHQSYPYVGYAMGKRPQQRDADILKNELHLNTVRCSHYMQSRYFLDRCDELGLMVFEEIPGWGYIGGDDYKEVAFNDLRDMVLGHFNHPSIVIWGTRLNETADDDNFYRETARRCKEMDPTRPTTGVRWQKNSSLFEDIYSFNDYTTLSSTEPTKGEFLLQTQQQVTGLPYKVPYLLSEHTGPLLCTKPGDPAMQQERFALYHAMVLSKILCSDDYLGAIGWCMFDYNTHFDHSRQEKICYHGIMDMFRVPKWASYLYRSQKDPDEEIVLQPCTVMGRGERGEGVIPFYVLTNCDYIDVTMSTAIESKTNRFYPSNRFIGLPHPPIEVKEGELFFQPFWEGSTIIGYVDQKEVARIVCTKNPYLAKLDVVADDTELYCDRVDETRIVCTFRDTDGLRMLHHFGVGKIVTDGDIELIGPDTLPVMGGTIAFWVKTNPLGRKGEASVRVSVCRPDVEDRTINIKLI